MLFLSDNIFRNWVENVALTLETQTVVTLKTHFETNSQFWSFNSCWKPQPTNSN